MTSRTKAPRKPETGLSPEAQAFRDELSRRVGTKTTEESGVEIAARLFDERLSNPSDHRLSLILAARGWPLPEEVEAARKDERARIYSALKRHMEDAPELMSLVLGLSDAHRDKCARLLRVERKKRRAARREVERLKRARGIAHAADTEKAEAKFWRGYAERVRAALMDLVRRCGDLGWPDDEVKLVAARAALTPSTGDPEPQPAEPQPAEVNRDELHDIAGQVMALFVPSCPECCTPETDGDLCDPCAGKIADIERLLSRGAR